MKPLHEILTAAKAYLLPAGVKDEDEQYETAICYALTVAAHKGDITLLESAIGSTCIVDKMRSQGGEPAAFLLTLAKRNGWVPDYYSPISPGYIAFRDKWLDELIAEVTPLKPMHEILAAAKPYLLPAGVKDEEEKYEIRICYALGRAYVDGVLSDEESKVGCDRIMAKLRAQSPKSPNPKASGKRSLTLLTSVAFHNNWVHCTLPNSTEYIAFRDKWLDELIAEVTP